jgi:hypothetical protein
MNSNFFYEDGQGNTLNEQGDETMNLVEEVDPYNVDTLLTLSQYRAFQNRFPAKATEELDTRIEEIVSEIASELEAGRKHNVYSDKQKAVFYYFNGIKLCKAAPSGRKAQIEPHTAQKWVKRLKEDPNWNIYEEQTHQLNRKPSQLQEEHKHQLVVFFFFF